ncbi:MAG: type II secretion system F family protein [Candidatus Promineifilaceae bacterium]
MTSSTSSPKHTGKNSYNFKNVSAYDLFYQLTYMSAMAAAGISRSKTFEIAAQAKSPVAQYFEAVNTLVVELRYSYPDACRTIGEQAKSEEVRSFLLRFSDALRSGEPLNAFLTREADVQSKNYENEYERELESLKKWSDAFSSIIISVALIVIVNLVSTMIYSMGTGMMVGLVGTAVVMGFFGTWVVSRAAPQEKMAISSADGSADQRRALRQIKIMGPVAVAVASVMVLLGVHRGLIMAAIGALLFPVGFIGYMADKKINQKDAEVSSFLRSLGSMASSTGSTLKEALTKIDLSSFPTLQPDIELLLIRLQALVSPQICWQRFGQETGSRLTSAAVEIFYESVKVGADPEKVGFYCSRFASRTAQLRAKRRGVAASFSWLTLVMHATVGVLMVFVLEIIVNFMHMMEEAVSQEALDMATQNIAVPLASFSASDLQFLQAMTTLMVVLLAVISATAIIASDGGYKFKFVFYLSLLMVISGAGFWFVPPVVAKILTVS